ncbi:hypothetical protein [Coleofasciculus sp. E1-EBD-02]|uniref:hypothetical protein n=1 Tax=Coleofasciculus sp. E1-EBD-02 TaxID=3068481 RepID=UPI0032FB12C8
MMTEPELEQTTATPDTPDTPKKPEPPEPPETSDTSDTSETSDTSDTPEQSDTPEEETKESENDGIIFQAIGIVVGDVSWSDEGRAMLTMAGRDYPLFYTSRLRKAFNALKLEIKNTGEATQRLIVYPRVTHFPQRTKSHQISFQLVGFSKGEPDGVAAQLDDFEFQLRGLWQFIPVCRGPVVSIFRNFNRDRLDYIKQAEPAQKVRFMKASHLPLMWKDSPVKPFRFNPKTPKEEQGHPAFIQVKAKFLPTRNLFEFDALLAPPLDKAPKFLKASKADKTAVQQEKRQNKSPQKPSTGRQKPEGKEQQSEGKEQKPSIKRQKPYKKPKVETKEQQPSTDEQKPEAKEPKPTTEEQKPEATKPKPSKVRKRVKAKEQKPEDKQ